MAHSRDAIIQLVRDCEEYVISPPSNKPQNSEDEVETPFDKLGTITKQDLSRTDAFSLVEILESIQHRTVEDLWSTFARTLNLLSQKLSNLAEGDDESSDLLQVQLIQHVDNCACFALAWLKDEKTKNCTGLESCVLAMHNLLFSLEGNPKIQNRVCMVCERWWLQQRPNQNMVVTQLIPVLLIRTLDQSAKDVDVKRIFKLRDMLELVDLEDPSAEVLKQLLLRCFIAPSYLRLLEGKRFLVAVMMLEESFLPDIHSTVLSQIYFCHGKKGVVKSFAEVYFKAWRSAEGSFLEAIETGCIQDIMDKAIHTADSKMAKSLISFLNYAFHENKKVKGVDAMLVNLYSSLLWRSLKVANSTVRHNAASILFHAFPIEDSSRPVAESQELMDRQFGTIEELLKDPCSQVRVVAVQGVSRILSLYWELVPLPITSSFLLTLANDLINDKASPAVRCAVLDGLGFVVENPLSQNALKEILPHLAPHIHDRSPSVRVAFVKLLLKVRGLKTIKFYHVVPVDDLLERLALDQHVPSIAEKMVDLILPSFFPKGASGTEQVKRAVALVKRHPGASRGFFANLHRKASIENCCKLILLLGKWLSSKFEKKKTQLGARSALDEQFNGALSGVVSIWRSVNEQIRLPGFTHIREELSMLYSIDTFVSPMMRYIQSRMSDDVEDELPSEFEHPKHMLLEIAALVCPTVEAAEDLREDLVSELCEFDPFKSTEGDSTSDSESSDAESQSDSNVSPIVLAYARMERVLAPSLNCLCVWGRENSALRAAVLALRESLEIDRMSQEDVPQTGVKRSVQEDDGLTSSVMSSILKTTKGQGMHPLVAAWVFHRLLTLDSARVRMIAQSHQVSALLDVLSQSVSMLVKACMQDDAGQLKRSETHATFILVTLYTKLLVYRELGISESAKIPSELVDLVKTCETSLLDRMLTDLTPFHHDGPATPATKPARQRRRKREGDHHTPSHLAQSPSVAGGKHPKSTVEDGVMIPQCKVAGDLVVLILMSVSDCVGLDMEVKPVHEPLGHLLGKLAISKELSRSNWEDQTNGKVLNQLVQCATKLMYQVLASEGRTSRGSSNNNGEVPEHYYDIAAVMRPLMKALIQDSDAESLSPYFGTFIAAVSGIRFRQQHDKIVNHLFVGPLLETCEDQTDESVTKVFTTVGKSVKSVVVATDMVNCLMDRLMLLSDPSSAEVERIADCIEAFVINVPEKCRERVHDTITSLLNEPQYLDWSCAMPNDTCIRKLRQLVPASVNQLDQLEV